MPKTDFLDWSGSPLMLVVDILSVSFQRCVRRGDELLVVRQVVDVERTKTFE